MIFGGGGVGAFSVISCVLMVSLKKEIKKLRVEGDMMVVVVEAPRLYIKTAS